MYTQQIHLEVLEVFLTIYLQNVIDFAFEMAESKKLIEAEYLKDFFNIQLIHFSFLVR